MDFDQIVAAARAWAAKEGIKLDDAIRRFASALLGEDVGMLTAPAGFKVVHLKDETAKPKATARLGILSAEDRDYCRSIGADPASVERQVVNLRAEGEVRARVRQVWEEGR